MRTTVKQKRLHKMSLNHSQPVREFDVEAWEKTDRLFSFPQRQHMSPGQWRPSGDFARDRWLVENDVHTEFLDAGIGCCWFAHQGDAEPVSGETEDEALTLLARRNGFELWREANATVTPEGHQHAQARSA